ncbi:MAG: hypothetical protein RIQ33_2066 [Bacteroidota bacterium]|jgi:hypothetical protein
MQTNFHFRFLTIFLILLVIRSFNVNAQITIGGTPQTGSNIISTSSGSLELTSSSGDVGIGTAAPSQLLEVSGGNIHLFTPNTAYMLGSNNILWHNGTTSNIFVGVNAGNSNLTLGTRRFTLIGNEAGFKQTSSAHDVTAIGYQAGYGNIIPSINAGGTFIGSQSGFAITSGDFNTFVGTLSGTNSNTNPFTGTSAGGNNVFIGYQTGSVNIGGNSNTLIGTKADLQFDNIIGASALGDHTIVGGNLATAIGANASAPVTNTMILGANKSFGGGIFESVKVGIGLSADLGGPRNYLEINADPNSFNTTSNTYTYTGVGGSGLTFRQLRSLNTPVNNTSNGVLSVNSNGEVIMVYDQTGTGTFNGAVNGSTINGGGQVEWGQNPIGGTGAPLLHHTEIPMVSTAGKFNIYFSGVGNYSNPADIGIGYDAITSGNPTVLGAKLDVLNANNSASTLSNPIINRYGGRFITVGGPSSSLSGDMVGVYGQTVIGNETAINISALGGDFYGSKSKKNYGVRGQATDAENSNINYGVVGFGANAVNVGIGVLGASKDNKKVGYGVYGKSEGNNLNYGVYGGVDCQKGT